MDDALAFPALVLTLSGQLVQEIHGRVSQQGFEDLRPAHGFAFARISLGDATTADLAEHLGVTKQAAAQLVEELVRKGYVVRHPHPRDARARLLGLTEAGWAATRAADKAARASVRPVRVCRPASRRTAPRSSAPRRPPP
ncbi:MarR family winged helix-turn-helix transcriptional regulator, partial [Streptomyces sp. NPDC002920]